MKHAKNFSEILWRDKLRYEDVIEGYKPSKSFRKAEMKRGAATKSRPGSDGNEANSSAYYFKSENHLRFTEQAEAM